MYILEKKPIGILDENITSEIYPIDREQLVLGKWHNQY